MKFTQIFIVAVLSIGMFFSTVDTNAQITKKRYHQSIAANPLGLAFGLLNATYEHQVSANNTFTVSGYYWSFADWTAIGFGGSYRWYILKDGPSPIEGFSFGPAVSFSSWDYGIDGLSAYDGGINLSIGAEAAYKWVFDGFVVEPIISLSFGILDIDGLSYRPLGAGVNLGYAW